jgi:uncharacterized membrane protein YphA (DoxX/SURF4 family)
MLSMFPQLLWLTPFSFVLMRLVAAIALAYGSWKHVFHGTRIVRAFGILELALAVLIFVGAYTQAAALIGALVMLCWIFIHRIRPVSRVEALLLLVIALSLVVTGSGPYAFDLPL